MFKIGVVGCGYWGPNLVRNFLGHPSVEKVFCYDKDKRRLSFIKRQFPMVEATEDFNEMVKNPEIDAIAIATPVFTHFPIAKEAIEQGKDVLIEKPLTSKSSEAELLIELAEKKRKTVMVDHTFIYTGAVKKIKEIISNGEIGNIMYFDSVRVNLGLFQHDINVVWDLAPHDISIMDYIIDETPKAVSAIGINHYNQFEDVAYLTVYFNGKSLAHFHVNWLAPVKVRNILVGGTKKMILYDDTEPSEKVKVYDKGVEVITREGVYETLIQYRTGDMYAPKLDTTEALTGVVNEFLSSIEEDRPPLTDGLTGLNVVKILEASEQSIKNNSKIVYL
ncbi:Gfo/Idh/MocA family oxidoreductase [candidate division WOR-3 bacterium]|nr:Gfo/Idh/MocA family oxidoreductase [candidate division WOR-3 bacterium]